MPRQLGAPASMDRDDPDIWRAMLDYYVKLHELNDGASAPCSMPSTDSGAATTPSCIFTSDHGDQCGSHRLRSKGPWNYQETMRIPLYVRAPGHHRGRGPRPTR